MNENISIRPDLMILILLSTICITVSIEGGDASDTFTESGVKLSKGRNGKSEKESPTDTDKNRNGLLNRGLQGRDDSSTFKEFYIKSSETERSKSGPNPSVDEIISGIIQLIGGNVKLGRPPNKPQIPSHFSDPELYGPHGTRINNRSPAGSPHIPSLVPPSVLIGPGPHSGQPLPLSPYNKLSKPHPPGLPPNGYFDESDISMMLGHKLVPQAALHPPRRIPGNTILPKYPPVIEAQFFSPSPSSHSYQEGSGAYGHHYPVHHVMEEAPSIHYSRSSETPVILSTRSVATETPFQSEQKLKLPSVASSSVEFTSSTFRINSGQVDFTSPSSTSSSSETSFASYTPPSNKPSKEKGYPDIQPSAPFSHSSIGGTTQLLLDHHDNNNHHSDVPNNSSNNKSTPHDGNDATDGFSTTSSSSSPSLDTSPDGEISDWIPVHLAAGLRPTKTWAEAPPIIITQEEPSVFDITIKHKIGASVADTSFKVSVPLYSSSVTSSSLFVPPTLSPSSPSVTSSSLSPTPSMTKTLIESSTVSTAASHIIKSTQKTSRSLIPTRVTASHEIATTFLPTAELKIRNSNKTQSSIKSSEVPAGDGDDDDDVTISSSAAANRTLMATRFVTPTSVLKSGTPSTQSRKVNMAREETEDVIYGKPAISSNHPIAPSIPEVTVTGSGVLNTQELPTRSSHAPGYHRTPIASVSPFGRPIVVPVDVDEVKPKMGVSGPSVVTEPGQGSVYIDGRPTHFKVRPVGAGAPTLQVGSAVSVDPHDNSPAGGNNNSRTGSTSRVSTAGGKHPAVRRPPFRPRPVVPLVRIDTCIVGDDTTCDVKMNEKCKTELGISSCQCRPGFGRSTPRGMCSPTVTLSLSLRIDKMADHKLIFSRSYLNPNSEEYQFLEFESIQGLTSLFSQSRLSKVFLAAKVNKFYALGGKMLVNASIDLEQNNVTRSSSIKRVLQQELARVMTLRNSHIGDSQLSVEATANAVTRVDDINECSAPDLNDCSSHAACINEFGNFRCMCKKGFEDKFPNDPKKAGRHCASCSPYYCSNRGECYIVNGERECRCRGNFIGSKCDIDVEVLGVAVGGSVAALVIIVITFLCLYMWNQRWKSEQQKIEAMSAASAQTFSYVNKQQTATVAAAGYRYAIDDRFRWAHVNEANFYASPEHILATSQQQHVYATPSRVQTPDALLSSQDVFESRHNNHYTRPSRSKSRNSTLHGHYQPSANTIGGPGSIFNETEFSTRETLYTPSHLIMTNPRSKYAVYS